MAWFTLSALPGQTFSDVREELETASPRATAIVGAAFVEDHLQRLIHSRLVHDKKVVEQMFGPSSALGTFSSKINLGFLMGLYSTDARRELDCIRSIRNDFAHELHINSFDIPSIKDRCATLKLWQTIQISFTEAEEEVSDKLTKEVAKNAQPKPPVAIINFSDGVDASNPRARYVAACRFFLALFAVLINFSKRPAAPEI